MSLELFVYLLHYIVCLGEGVPECASTRDPDALPQAPTPKSLPKSGLALSPGRRFLHIITLRIGMPLDLLVLVEKAEQEQIKSGAIRFVCVVGNATSVASMLVLRQLKSPFLIPNVSSCSVLQ